ncbi:flagellar protein FliT [Paraburkholderia sp. JHI869]|uniref:flagellar protein FliT n=1 Tax=Paraburkholderia sp. JHI869 TaxID=3112959 RepID=UPI00316D72D0
MADIEQTVLVDRIVALTGDIEHAAALDDWIEASRLVEARSPFLMSLSARQSPAALAALRSVIARDAAVMASAQHSQGALRVEFNAAMGRSKAVGMYHQTARL